MSRLKEGNVFLARHAQPDWDRTDLVYHLPPGPPLTETGIAQAGELAEFLAGERVTRIFSSPLERCSHTASLAAQRLGLELSIDARLAERQPGETLQQQAARIMPVFELAWTASKQHGPVVLVTHGGPAQALLLELGLPQAEARRYIAQFDHQNLLPTAGAWQITHPNGTWEHRLVFVPGTGQALI